MTITMSMIKLRPPALGAVSVVEPVNPHALRIVQREAVFDAVRPSAGGFDQLRRNLDPIALRKLELKSIEVQQYLQVILFGHANIVATSDIFDPSGWTLGLSIARRQVSEDRQTR